MPTLPTFSRTMKIGISGSYGGMNLGDEAILEGILGQLRATVPVDVTVFTRNVADTLARHRVARAVPVRDLTRRESSEIVRDLDLLVLGGGGILYDRDAAAYLREVFLAHEHGVPVVVYAISAGPLATTSARAAVREALNACAVVSVRDREGYRMLEDVGVTRDIRLTADPALLLEREELSDAALEAEGVELAWPASRLTPL
jgi:polysaccharide pyruvyl transferase WcaK-like protein